LWRLAGFLTFAYTVLQLPERALATIRKFQAERGLIQDEEWDLEDNVLIELVDWATERVNCLETINLWQRKSPSKSVRDHVTLSGVFDATPIRWAYSIFREGTEGTEIAFEASGELPNLPIDEAEAYAASQLIQKLLQQVTSNNTIVIVAGDNQPVLYAFQGGFSTSLKIDASIRQSGILVSKCIFLLVDIPSEENYADIATRPTLSYTDEDRLYRLCATTGRLNIAGEKFRRGGGTFFKRNEL
jgi:hypothetical protein